MVKKTLLQSIIAFFVAFSLSFVQSQQCYANNSTGVWDNETKIIAATVGVGGGAALLWWLLKNDDSKTSNPSPSPATKGVPVIHSKSNYNLLYMAGKNSSGGTSIPGKIWVLNNSDQAATNGFVLTPPPSSNVTVSSDSSCLKTVPAKGECFFQVSYTASSTPSTTSFIPPTTATLKVESGASSSDSVTVNTINVPDSYLIHPILFDTNAHGINAAANINGFATVQKNGIDFVYAAVGGDGGVYKTDDSGKTWLAVYGAGWEVLKGKNVYALYAIDSVLYAGTDGGVFSSADGGATWTQIKTGLIGKALSVNTLASIGGKLYAGTSIGVYVLDISNPGAGWTPVSSKTFSVKTLCAVNNILCAGFLDDGIYYYDTTSVTADWITIGNGSTTITQATVLYSDGTYLYAGDNNLPGVYRILVRNITVSDAAWESFGASLESINVYALSFFNGKLYAGTYGSGVYKIDPAAASTTNWTQTSLGFRNQSARIKALYSTSNVLYAGLESSSIKATRAPPAKGIGGGIYTTTPATEETWILVSNTLTLENVRALFKTDSGTIYAGTYGDGVFKSTDGGANWTPITNDGLTNLNIKAVALLDNYLYVGVYNDEQPTTPAVFRINITSPKAWESAITGLPENITANALNVDSNGLSVGIGVYDLYTKGGVYIFDGTQWHCANGPGFVPGTKAITSSTDTYWASSPSYGDTFLGGVFSGNNPLKTTTVWKQLDADGLTNKNVLSLQFNSDGNFLYAGCGASTSTDPTAFKISNTDGASWEDITGTSLSGNPVNAYCLYNNKLYAGVGYGTSKGGVYVYTDGTTWNLISSYRGLKEVYALQSLNSDVYAGTDSGILRATIA